MMTVLYQTAFCILSKTYAFTEGCVIQCIEEMYQAQIWSVKFNLREKVMALYTANQWKQISE